MQVTTSQKPINAHPMDRAWGENGWVFGGSGVCMGHQESLKLAGFECAHLWLLYDMQSTFASCHGVSLQHTFEQVFAKARVCAYAFKSEQPIEAQKVRTDVLQNTFMQEVARQVNIYGGVAPAFGLGVWQLDEYTLVVLSLQAGGTVGYGVDAFVQNQLRTALAKKSMQLVGMQTEKSQAQGIDFHAQPVNWLGALRAFKALKEQRALTWSIGWSPEDKQTPQHKRL